MVSHDIKIGGLVEYVGSNSTLQNEIATVRHQVSSDSTPEYYIQFKDSTETATVQEADLKPL